MRILQVGKYYHPRKGGIETHLRTLVTGLKAVDAGLEVKVLVAGDRRGSLELIDGISVERLPVAVTAFGAPLYPRLIPALLKNDPDIVHVHLPNPWAALAFLASGSQKPLVVTYHSDIIRQSVLEPAIRPVTLALLKRASAIICTSQNLVDQSPILKRFRERCIIIPLAIKVCDMAAVDQAAVNAIKRKHTKPLLLAVGRLVYYKGFKHLIEAMANVDASLVIIGNGPLKKELSRFAEEKNVQGKLTILDHIEDVRPYHHAADIFILPSIARNEAFGIVQVEAMAAGKPVINTQIESGVPGVSLHGYTGLTVPPADPLALAHAINALLTDPDLRCKYGKAARQRALSEFDLEPMATRTLEVYHRVGRPEPVQKPHEIVSKAAARDYS